MNRILDIDLRNRRLTAQAGAVNIALTKAVAADGYLYAPDPSSQGASTLGGNIANNAGGPHTLKYGVTANHVLAVELVLPDGEIVTLGDKTEDVNGYDLLGLALGSEGTFGIVTEATVRLTRAPQAVRTLLAVFDTVDDATQTVSDIIAAGIVPAALEMMDAVILQTVEDAFHFGFPRDAGAILIIELDGLAAGLDAQADRVRALCEANAAREVRQAETAQRPRQPVGRPQKSRRHPGPPRPLLRHPGLRHPALQAARRPARHRRHRRQIQPADRQCLSCRRRQPAPRDPL